MSTPATTPTKRRAQIIQTYQMAKRTDPRLGLITLGVFVVGAAIGFAVIWFLPGRGPALAGHVDRRRDPVRLAGHADRLRSPRPACGVQADGGAARCRRRRAADAARGWKIDPVVGFTKQQDIVHRVVGPPGIVLVGEG